MSLNKPQLIADLNTLYDNTLVASDDAEAAKTAFVTELANIIDGYIKSAHITYTSGLTAGTTLVTGTFNGNLS